MRKKRKIRKDAKKYYDKQVKKAKKELWELQSKLIRIKSGGICFTCKKKFDWKKLEAGHFRHGWGDFEEKNIQAQCVKCNRYLHGNLGVYAVELDKKYGQGTAEELIRLSGKPIKYDLDFLLKKIEQIKNELKNYE
jgi:hypothetical protein